MNLHSTIHYRIAAIAAMILSCGSPGAHALDLSVLVVPPKQIEYTTHVKLGHLVTGRTNMISLLVGGTFRATCPSSYTGAIEGQNSRSQTYKPPNVLTVEVPAGWLPADREMPGFNSVPAGTTLTCSYRWTANGKEAQYSLGAGGLGIPVGGDESSMGDSTVFEMRKRGEDGERDNTSCIH